MEVFDLRNNVVNDYADYVRSFIEIRDPAINDKVEAELRDGFLWPDPLVQLNPSFEPGTHTEQLVKEDRACRRDKMAFRERELAEPPMPPSAWGCRGTRHLPTSSTDVASRARSSCPLMTTPSRRSSRCPGAICGPSTGSR